MGRVAKQALAATIMRICVLALCALLLTGLAAAHSPHLSKRISWVAPDGKPYSLATLWGDGLVGPDPGRPVVLDAAGQVVALGPLVSDSYVHCRTQSDCMILVEPRSYGLEPPAEVEAVVPDPSTFQAGRPPDFYPEYENRSYGFKPVALTPSDRWVASTVFFRRAPLIAVPWTLLWAWLGLKCGGIIGVAPGVGKHLPSFLPMRLLGFAVAWTGLALIATLVPLALATVLSWLHDGSLGWQPTLPAFLAGCAGGLMRALLRIVRALKGRDALSARPVQ